MIVYRLTCIPTGKIYIGITGRSVEVRFSEHLSNATRQRVDRRHLYNAMRKYPADAWVVEEIAAVASRAEACALEIKLIAEHRANDRAIGYNSTIGGDGVGGLEWTAEMRKRASESHKGRSLPEAAKQKLREYWADPEYRERAFRGLKNRKQTPEQIEKRAAALRGRARPADVRKRISDGNKGKSKSAQHIANSIAARRGYKKTAEQIERSAVFHRGRKRSDKTRQLLRDLALARSAKKRGTMEMPL